MSVNYVALGKRIGYFRMQCGNITQEALASKINRSREFLAKIEKGTEHPSIATLVDIADALCISVDDLLIDSLHYSVSTSNTELHRLLLDCNETEQEIIIRTAKELKATLVSLGKSQNKKARISRRRTLESSWVLTVVYASLSYNSFSVF